MRIFNDITLEAPPLYPYGSTTNIPMLFHYTNYDSLLGIISSKSLHATSIHFLNDYEEFKDALIIARQEIDLSKKRDKTYGEFLDRLKQALESIENRHVHIVSFTAKADLLSQWRAYCPLGGVAVGFRYDDLKTLAENNSFEIRKCIYKDNQKREIIRGVVSEKLDQFSSGQNEKSILNEFAFLMSVIAPCFKHKAFEEEQEWRLVCSTVRSDDPRIGLRSRPGLLIPYLSFSLDGLAEKKGRTYLSFDRFIIGPSQYSQLSGQAFTYLLGKHNLYYEGVMHSLTPYRTF